MNKRLYIRFLACLTVLLLIVGCSPQFHIKRAHKQQNKAIKKGAVFIQDTTYVTEFFEKIDTLTINDTTYITRTNTITNTIIKDGEVRYVTRWDKRKERQLEKRIYKDSIKIVKLETRQDGKTERVTVRANNRNRWYIWLLIGLVLGYSINFFLRNWLRVK